MNKNSKSKYKILIDIILTNYPDPVIILLSVIPATIGLLLVAFPLLIGEKEGEGVINIGFYLNQGIEFQI